MAQDFKQYVVDAMREEGISDAEISSALDKLYSNEKLGKRLSGIVKTATEDYNSQLGRVNAAQSQLIDLDKKWKDWAADATKSYNEALTQIETLQKGGGGAPPAFDASKYLTKEDLGKALQDQGTRYAAVIKESTRLANEHALRYQEPLDLDAIDKLAIEKGLPIRSAYNEWIGPREKEREVEARKKWEADKTAEIERDLRSRMNLPVDPTPPQVSHLFQRPPADSLPKNMDQELLAAWNSVPAGKT